MVDYLDNHVNEQYLTDEWVDIDTLPRRKTKEYKTPRRQKLSNFIKNWFTDGAMNEYVHLVLNVDYEDFEFDFNQTIDQMMLNLLNDISFYVRFMPGVNIDTLLSSNDSDGVDLNKFSLTRRSILKKN